MLGVVWLYYFFMFCENFNDLQVFVYVVCEGSFIKVVVQLGVFQFVLSYVMCGLEQCLGVCLLICIICSVLIIEVGVCLFDILVLCLVEIEDGLVVLVEYCECLVGIICINVIGYVVEYIVWFRLVLLLQQYLDLKVELVVDYGLVDIVVECYDIGICLGEWLVCDMIVVLISLLLCMCVVGVFSYFCQYLVSWYLDDLVGYNCVILCLFMYGGLMLWDFGQDGNELSVCVSGQWMFNIMGMICVVVLVGSGLVWLLEDQVQLMLDDGWL